MAPTRRNFRATTAVVALFGGAVAQLGERLVRNEEVRGSNPLGSTSLRSLRDLRLGKPANLGSANLPMDDLLLIVMPGLVPGIRVLGAGKLSRRRRPERSRP